MTDAEVLAAASFNDLHSALLEKNRREDEA